ncbi:prephenate dehydrogenase [Roseimaritima ulvae]|uniref:Prephenate dehydrogenase n=1 Tax=Roseimaritima ulvae TaxID=980254 RepID=A0A5B9QSX1_9BACT|nr:prephenate dehydrogenase/arogenate dehydrogenase family protein [Roseimaritima ulvae]QEG42217.1 prephenate dehydrogenase [Roseimaritima ulvae]
MTPSPSPPAGGTNASPQPHGDSIDFQPRKAAIIGVGLLGGSIGLALRRRWPSIEVFGSSRSEKKRQRALQTGCVTTACEDERAACRDADLIFICTPVGLIAEKAIQLAACCPEHALLTDVGSTKRKIVDTVESDARAAAKFVGSHPIAGGEKTGPEHATADLFENKRVVVTPTERTAADRLTRTIALWQALGAEVLQLSPSVHDDQLAGVSHATHFASCAVASILREDEITLIGSGWRDTTRVAAGDPQMWSDIAAQNAAPITVRLRAIRQQLDALIDAIDAEDRDTLMRLLTAAQQLRQCVPAPDSIRAPDSIPAPESAAETDSDA